MVSNILTTYVHAVHSFFPRQPTTNDGQQMDEMSWVDIEETDGHGRRIVIAKEGILEQMESACLSVPFPSRLPI